MKRDKEVAVGISVLALGLTCLLGCSKGKAAPPALTKDVAAIVNNKAITVADMEAKISKMPSYYQQMLKNQKREFLDDMVIESLLYEEAIKKGVEKDKEAQEMIEEAKKRIIISKFIKDEVEATTTVSEKEIGEYYNSHKDEFVTPEKIKASHILVNTEEEAKAVLDELSKGKVFEDLAKEKSKDTTANKGGDLGYFTKGQMVKEFEEAAFKLEVGQLSGVVKTQFGYHIIKVTDKKPASTQELTDVSERIKGNLLSKKRQQAFDDFITKLKSKANIQINEELFRPKDTAAKPEEPKEEAVRVPQTEQ